MLLLGDRKNVNERKTQNEVTQNADPIRDPNSCAVQSKLRPAKPQSAHKKATCHLPDQEKSSPKRETERESRGERESGRELESGRARRAKERFMMDKFVP